MRVRLTGIDDEVVVDGAAADPPQPGRPFAVLVASRGKVVLTRKVTMVGFDTFLTEGDGCYSWSRHVGDA